MATASQRIDIYTLDKSSLVTEKIHEIQSMKYDEKYSCEVIIYNKPVSTEDYMLWITNYTDGSWKVFCLSAETETISVLFDGYGSEPREIVALPSLGGNIIGLYYKSHYVLYNIDSFECEEFQYPDDTADDLFLGLECYATGEEYITLHINNNSIETEILRADFQFIGFDGRNIVWVNRKSDSSADIYFFYDQNNTIFKISIENYYDAKYTNDYLYICYKSMDGDSLMLRKYDVYNKIFEHATLPYNKYYTISSDNNSLMLSNVLNVILCR